MTRDAGPDSQEQHCSKARGKHLINLISSYLPWLSGCPEFSESCLYRALIYPSDLLGYSFCVYSMMAGPQAQAEVRKSVQDFTETPISSVIVGVL
jgi:hypothetical protein